MEKLFERLEEAVGYFTDCKGVIEYSFTHICMNEVLIEVSLCDDETFKKVFEDLSNAIIEQLVETYAILGMLEATINTYKGTNVDEDDPVFYAVIKTINDSIRDYNKTFAEFKNIVNVNAGIITKYLDAFSATATSIC